jgi:hypothetical protein
MYHAKFRECMAASAALADLREKQRALDACVHPNRARKNLLARVHRARFLAANEKRVGEWLASCVHVAATANAKDRCVDEHRLRLAWLNQLLADTTRKLERQRRYNKGRASRCSDGAKQLQRWQEAARSWWQKLRVYTKQGGLSPGWWFEEPDVCPGTGDGDDDVYKRD